ncbi:MAG: MOSC domain-containing protein [Pseudomonadota bacterium]
MFMSQLELEEGVEHVRRSPKDHGTIEQIVCRPEVDARQVLTEAELAVDAGLVGDNWLARGYRKREDGSAHPDMQLNLMNARAIALIAQTRERWSLAGDQFYVDLDLSYDNLPPGTRLRLGDHAVIEVTAEPHLGCAKFMERFGRDAARFVNSELGKALNLRGINARVVSPGSLQVGAPVSKVSPQL